jgi:uncharacterized protein YbjT (DUF2867 family)
MILVVGSTGLVGSSICLRLAQAGKSVTGLVRSTSDPAKVERLKQAGVHLVTADLKDRASIDAACKGASAVISTASSTLSRQEGDSIDSVDLEGQLGLVDAAKTAGVGQFVFISFSCLGEFPLQTAKRAVEARIQQSGMSYTILQPAYFTEVWLGPALGFDYPNAKARIYGSGNAKMSWISFEDVAAFAVAAIDNPKVKNGVFELGGPDALSALEVVRAFEAAGGRPFALEHVPEEALRAQLAAAPDPMSRSFAGLMLSCALGNTVDMKRALAAMPVSMRRVHDYVKGALGG